MAKQDKSAPTRIRCAIYTRKSTEEGLEQEFNSLDAQREAGEAYIQSQASEGWECLPDRYDDGGFTGGNMERPALQRLMADIEAGNVDCVVVYKVDRLSRSLLDFARIMGIFEKEQVSFVSVTQQFNTNSSMGRLVLNVLLSFAQFEREMISERTRDKIAAARRKGKWSGGMPLLGYDVDDNTKLVVNDVEAAQVRAIYEMYLEKQALLPVVEELDRRGWVNKRWTTRKGHSRGGRPFNKATLYNLLTNPTYCGKVRYKDEVHPGEHEAIIGEDVQNEVKRILHTNGRTGGVEFRNKFGAILKGLLRCTACGCAMSPHHSTKAGNKRYRYYVCNAAQKRGWTTCPAPSIPAGEIERFVVDQIRHIGNSPELIDSTVEEIRSQGRAQIEAFETEERVLHREMLQWNKQVRELVGKVGTDGSAAIAQLADLQERIRKGEARALEIRDHIDAIQRQSIGRGDVAKALGDFDGLWDSLTIRERIRLVSLLVERVEYDGKRGKVAVTFQPDGIQTLAEENEEALV